MSVVDKSQHGEDWLYNNGYLRRVVYPFSGLSTSSGSVTLRVVSSTNHKIFDRFVKPTSGRIKYEVLINPSSVTYISPATVIDQPLNYRVLRPTHLTVDVVTITGGTLVDVDEFFASAQQNKPSSTGEQERFGRDFASDQVFYLKMTNLSQTDEGSGYVKYIAGQTP